MSHIQDRTCLFALYDPIVAVNSCMTENGRIDVVTGITSTRCTKAELDQFFSSHYPWANMLAQRKVSAPVGDYVAQVASLGCYTCFDPLYTAMPTTSSDCDAPYSDECKSLMDIPLEAFAVCSGGLPFVISEMSVAICTADEWTALGYPNRSMVPLIVAGKYSSDALETDSVLAYLKEAITGLACEPCFSRFISDINALYASDDSVESTCADPYSADCRTALSVPLGAFTSCSAQELNWSSTSTLCTEAEFESLVTLQVPANVIAAAFSSNSEEAFAEALNSVFTAIDTANLEAPCWSCFTELAHAVYNLDPADTNMCQDIFSDACLTFIGTELNAFENCSGSVFVLHTTTTIYPTTSTSTSTFALTESEPTSGTLTTYSTLTSSKSAEKTFCLGFIILIQFILL